MKESKIENIFLFCVAVFVIFSILMLKPISNLDEIWNYNTARAITMGLLPYKDISMITTPLLPFLTAIILKIVANEVIVSRILASVLCSLVLLLSYKIINFLIKEENLSLIFTILIGILFRESFCIDYNWLVLLISLIMLYIELKNKDKKIYNKKIDFCLGILAGLAFCTKQSSGFTICFIMAIYKIVFVKNKEDFKEYLKSFGMRVLGIIIPITIFVLYLIISKSFKDFLDYAVFGISTFNNKIKYSRLFYNEKIEIKIWSIGFIITLMIMSIIKIYLLLKNKQNEEKYKNFFILFAHNFVNLITMYPISDVGHFLLGSLITLISLFYLISLLMKKIYYKINIKNKKRIFKNLFLIIWIIMFFYILLQGEENIKTYIKSEKSSINHFRLIQKSEYIEDGVKTIDDFIKQKEKEGYKVYILDAEAACYMIPIDYYNKDYDMFLIGNIGKDGEDGQIEKIKQNDEKALFLIKKENLKLNWQTPTKVIDYLRNNLKKEGIVFKFEIYEK